MLRLSLGFITLLLLGGCYDASQDRLIEDENFYGENIRCQHSYSSGCIEGTVLSAPDIYINNKIFEDSDDFAQTFGDLVKVTDEKGNLIERDAYQLSLVTPLGNREFTKDFTVYIKGRDARQVGVLRNGQFYIDNLKYGVYEIRAQRKIRFKISRDVEVEDGEGSLVTQTQEKEYCATLKAEDTLHVYSGRRVSTIFEDFELTWRDRSCGEAEGELNIVTL